MDVLIYAAFFILAILLFVVLMLQKKLINKVGDTALKVDFFDQKLDSENKKILETMNQQYTDVLTALKEMKEKVNPELGMGDDELYEQAKEIAAEYGICSASLLQRTLRVGYARAARLMDMLEDAGLVEPADGAKPRRYIGEDNSE